MQDVHNKENCVQERGDIWEFSAPSAQFFYKPKIVKNKIY